MRNNLFLFIAFSFLLCSTWALSEQEEMKLLSRKLDNMISNFDQQFTDLHRKVNDLEFKISDKIDATAIAYFTLLDLRVKDIKKSDDKKLKDLASNINAGKCFSCQSPFKSIPGVGCIHIIEKSQTFDVSRRNCQELGGDLFVADDAAHYYRLASHFFSTGQGDIQDHMWVGVKEGKWLSGRNVDPLEEAPGNPEMKSGTCSYTDGDTKEKFLLWTHPCTQTWWALCQQKKP